MGEVRLPRITRHNGIDVVRGDDIAGGFKRLAIDGVFTKTNKVLVMASSSGGLGPRALVQSLNGEAVKRRPIIFLSRADERSETLARCEQLGANLKFLGDSAPADAAGLRDEALQIYTPPQTGEPGEHVKKLCPKRREALHLYAGDEFEVLPRGLENAEVEQRIAELTHAIFPTAPKTIWMAAGSGFVVRAMQQALPFTEFHAVLVKHNGKDVNIGRAIPHTPDEIFKEPAYVRPPYPSSPRYDAKVWRQLLENLDNEAALRGEGWRKALLKNKHTRPVIMNIG